ncbi:MAG: hypothetical protein UH734_00110 [Ruminococcus sp.]|nr:hypothetical protein [Ruminococcus sp.]
MQKLKRPVSIILSILMVVSMFVAVPVTASAADYVAQIGGTGYETLEAAFAAAQDGDTIVVVNEITNLSQITIPAGKNITLDLGNQKVSGQAGLFKVPAGTSLTVQNGTLESVAADNKYAIYVASKDENGGTFVLGEDATIKTTGTDSGAVRGYAGADITINGTVDAVTYGVVVTKSAKLTVNSTAVINASENAIASNGNPGNEGYKIVINGGTIGSANTKTAIYHQNNGTLTINDGSVKGKTAVYVKSGTTEIKGGTFVSSLTPGEDYSYNGNGTNSTGDAIVVDNCGYPGGAPTVSIKGGTFTVTDKENANPVASYSYGDGNDPVVGFISGGTYNEAVPAELCATGFEPKDNGNNTYGVETIKVAKIGDVEYDNLQTALNEATAGNEIVILEDIALTGAHWFNVDKEVTINLNEKTISSEDSVFALQDGGNLTVKNGTMTSTVANDYAIYVQPNSTFTLASDATLKATNANGNGMIVKDGCTANIDGTIETGYYSIVGVGTSVVNVNNGASITSTDASAISGNGSGGNEGYTFNVKGGTLTSTNDVAIYHPNRGTLNITGGTITGKTAVYVKSGSTSISGSSTSISGATISGTGEDTDMVHSGNGCNATGDAIVIENCGYPGGTPAIAISGGTITSVNAQPVASYGYNDGTNDYKAITEFISGGTYNKAVPAELCAPAYAPVDNGDSTYGVAKAYVAKIGTTKYKTFAQAVADRANNDDVITLLDKVTDAYTGENTDFPIKVAKDGKSVTVKVNGAYIVSSSTADGVTTYTITEAAIEFTSTSGAVSYKSNIDYTNLSSSGTYKLLKDITANSRIVPTIMASNVTIDLNGHTLTSNATDQAFLFSRGGSKTFVITDNSTNGGGKIVANNLANTGTSNTASVISISGNNNNVTISNITIETTQGIGLIGTNQSLSIDNCDITVNGTDYALATNGSQTNGATINVTDSSIESTNGIAVYLPGGATSTFTDTNVTGTTAMYIKSGTTTIDGGTYTATGDAAEFTHNGNGANATGDAIVVESCNYPNGVPTVSIGATNVVSAHGKQIGDYTYGENVPFGDVTATSNTLTLPEDLKWVETETEGVYEVAPKEYVAQNSKTNTKYEDLQTALNEATAGDEIVVLDNIALTGAKWFVVNKDVTIDLNGKTISSEDSVFVTTNGADLTVKNGTMTSSVANDYAIYVNDGSVFTLKDNATLKATNANGNGIIVRSGGQADIYGTIETGYYSIAGFGTSVVNVNNGASITSTDASALSGNGSDGNEGYTFNVKGGTLTSTNDVAIYHPNQGTLNITGGTITGKTAVYVKSGSTNVSGSGTSISGATIHGTGADTDMVHSGNGCNATGDAIVIENCGYPGGTPNVSLSGGTITSDNADAVASYGYNDGTTEYEPIKEFVSGGTFNTPVPKEYCATGFKPKDNGNGTYGVTKKLFTGHSVTLGGNIGVNFFINSTFADFKNATKATVKFTWDNNEYSEEVNLKTMTPDAGIYKASVEVVAAHMAHKIHAVVYINGEALAETDDYSVQDYAEAVYKDNNKPKKLRDLAKAMLNYGAEAQTVFDSALKTHPDRADINVGGAADYSGVTAELVKSKINGTASDLNEVATQLDANYYTNSLIYLQNNTLRIYFTPKTYPADMPHADAYDDNLSSYYYYKDVEGIAAANLDDPQEFSIAGVNFTYSPLNYVADVLSSNMSLAQKNLAASLFLYNQAANAYFG